MTDIYPFTMIGIILISLGVLLVLIPLLIEYTPSLVEVHPLIIYVYHRNNVYFVTSPILLLTCIISIIFFLLHGYIN